MLVHGMTLVFFRLFRKNLGNLQKWLTPSPSAKIAGTPMDILRLTELMAFLSFAEMLSF